MALLMFIFRVKGIFVSSNLINSCVIMKHSCSGHAASQAPAWVLEEKDNLGALQWRSGTARLTSPMHCLLWQPWVAPKMWLCPGQGPTGGLGKGGAQGLNDCDIKQVFRMDKIRPEVVVHLLLLLSDGYWLANQKWNWGNLVILREGVTQWVLWARQDNGPKGEFPVWGPVPWGVLTEE